ncbi:HEAT repeat domain-containing protein [Candidatus Bipolaricaulota bacterium]|nr:HEAT repeat domain-containing protein [Candidatus Bipolaricaulota bacterium]
MIELLQNLQLVLGSFVTPIVVAISLLLLLAIVVYTLAVFFNWKVKKDRKKFREAWAGSLKGDNISSVGENLSGVSGPLYDPRDDFLEVLREAKLSLKQTVDIYQWAEFYDKDKTDLFGRAWWRRAQALHRLKHLSPADLEDKFTSLIYDSSHEVRLIALDSLSSLEEVSELDPVELFESFTEELDPFLVIKLLALKPGKRFLRPLVNSKKHRLRRAGATLLGQPDKQEFLPLLSNLSDDEDSRVRKNVAESLGRVGGLEALPLLKQTSEDGEPGVREASARSLGEIFHEDSIDTLNELATDDDFEVRLAAFISLSRFGEEGRKAIGNHWSENRRLAREAIFESYQK